MLSFSISRVPWRYDLRQEPDAVIPLVRIRAGGLPERVVPTATASNFGFSFR